ncbi:MAG TPA: hydantoinase B/oxoprolinase family protein [Candidatus Udaeobacter sp.]|nr:hydantoinase B/oxoprolinase family protein [Candidatus Udaeobacter sp.]
MTRDRASRSRASTRRDAVSLALDQGLFAACAEEMGATLTATAHSPNITERLDFSCAIFDSRARLIAQAAHIPVHLGSMPAAAVAALDLAPFAPGDAIILNDPFAGGTHLPDVTLVTPVFLGGRAPDFFVASRAHHADIGGAAAGSMPLAREIYAEGVRIPPVRLVRGGRIDTDLLRLVLANVRTPDERRADLAAQLGAQATGARRLADLAARRSREALRASASALIRHGERAIAAALRRLPPGSWRFEDALDDDGLGSGPVRIAAKLTLGRGGLTVDFTGSSPQVAGPVNTVQPVTQAAVFYVVRVVIGRELPVNHGVFRSIRVIAPVGSVVNARPPAAVAAGNVETSQRIVDVVLGAFARALPERIPAASYGTMSNLLIGGWDPRRDAPFAYYETLGGGHGAGPGWNGASAMQAHMTNTRNTPIESLEHAYPLRVRSMRIRRGSGGAGRWRGGDGLIREVELLADTSVTVMSERRARPPYGLAGGGPGSVGVNELREPRRSRTRVRSDSKRSGASVVIRRLGGKFHVDLKAGAVLTVASPGGGGHGRTRRPASPRK